MYVCISLFQNPQRVWHEEFYAGDLRSRGQTDGSRLFHGIQRHDRGIRSNLFRKNAHNERRQRRTRHHSTYHSQNIRRNSCLCQQVRKRVISGEKHPPVRWSFGSEMSVWGTDVHLWGSFYPVGKLGHESNFLFPPSFILPADNSSCP